MNQIAAPAHITPGEPRRVAMFTSRSLCTRVLKSLITTVIRKEEDDKSCRAFASCGHEIPGKKVAAEKAGRGATASLPVWPHNVTCTWQRGFTMSICRQ
jgi:hypothetical protein